MDNEQQSQIQEINTNIITNKSLLRKEQTNLKAYLLITIVAFILLISHYTNLINIPAWALILCWIFGILFLLAAIGTDINKIKTDIEINESNLRILKGLPDNSNDEQYFNSLVKINVENLAAYYSLVKTHSSQSFKSSLLVSILGFILIGVGLTIGFNHPDNKLSFISTGAGLIIEFISGILFYLYNKTIIQLKGYHDSLIEVQNILLSFKLIEGTSNENMKTEMTTKMIESLVGNKKLKP